jgi:hypothetical protein
MADLAGALNAGFKIVAVIGLILIFLSEGWAGKAFVVGCVIVFLAYSWWKIKKEAGIDAREELRRRIVKSCLKREGKELDCVELAGDRYSTPIRVGNWVGFTEDFDDFEYEGEADSEGNSAIEGAKRTDPRTRPLYVLVASGSRLSWKIPILGWILKKLRKYTIIKVYAHQRESLYNRGVLRLLGSSLRISHPNFVFVVNDIVYNNEALDLTVFRKKVHNITLEEDLAVRPQLVRNAVDSSPNHIKALDTLDIPAGQAQNGGIQ